MINKFASIPFAFFVIVLILCLSSFGTVFAQEDSNAEDSFVADIGITLCDTYSADAENIKLSSSTIAYGECGEYLTWTLDADGILTISDYGDMYDWTSPVSTPWYSYSEQIKYVVIGPFVKSIGEYAFQRCTGIQGVYYEGTPLGWDSVEIGAYNVPFVYSYVYFPNIISYGECGENINWYIYKDGTLEIFGYGKMRNFYSEMAPWHGDREHIKSVHIDSLSSNILSISDYAFEDCYELETVAIPSSVTSIGKGAFDNCYKLARINIPSSVESIGGSAFSSCENLSDITIPYKLTKIESFTFYGCTSLTSVHFSNRVTSIGANAFCLCDNLSQVYYNGTEDMWNNMLVISTGNNCLTSANINYSGFLEQGDGWTLTADGILTISKTLSKIDWLDRHNNIVNVIIEEGVSGIDSSTFSSCQNLESFCVNEKNSSLSHDANGVLFNKNKTALIAYPRGKKDTFYEIPDTVEDIYKYAFENSVNLKRVSFGSGVYYIGVGAFKNCTALKEVKFPEGVKDIDSYAFYRCTALETVTFPRTLKYVSNYVFEGCDAIKEIYYNGSEDMWSKFTIYAYNGSLKNANVNFLAVAAGSFWFVDLEGTLTIEDETGTGEMQDWTSSENVPWYSCRTNIKKVLLSGNFQNIGNYAFFGLTKLEEINLPDSIETIGAYAFYNCDSLTELCLPIRVETIQNYTFYHCDALKYVNLENIFSFGDYSFAHCKKFENGNLTNAYSIGKYAFYRGESLKNLVFDDITLIDTRAFYACTGLETIRMSSGIDTVSSSAFGYCSNISTVYYRGFEIMWDHIDIANGNTYLTNAAIIYDPITSIKLNGFCYEINEETFTMTITGKGHLWCPGLFDFNLPNYQYAVKHIVIGDNITQIGNYCFNKGLIYLEAISLPDDCVSIGYGSFICENLSVIHYYGTREQWDNVCLPNGNTNIKNATVICMLEESVPCFDGAQIRTQGVQGLRFIFRIPTILAKESTFGSVVMPKKYLGDNTLEIGTTTILDGKEYVAKNVPALKIFMEENGYTYYTVCITRIKKANHSSEYVAVPYIITKDENGNETIIYGEPTSDISVDFVKQALVNA